MIEVEFTLKNDFGKTQVSQTFDEDVIFDDAYEILDAFRKFMIVAGYDEFENGCIEIEPFDDELEK